MERDINLAKSGKDLIYKTLIGLKADLSKPAETPEILANKHKTDNKSMKERSDASTSSEDSNDSDSENESETGSEDDNNRSKFVNSARPRNESPESRKVRFVFIFLLGLSIRSMSHLINLYLYLTLRRVRRQSRNSKRRSEKSR